jgi:uncharacterized membrane protein
MSLPVFADLYGRLRDRVDDLSRRLRLKVRMYRLKQQWRILKDELRQAWDERYRPYLSYILNEFIWIVLANGLILNIIFDYFLGFPLTPYSVVAWGALWYAVVMMTPSLRRSE